MLANVDFLIVEVNANASLLFSLKESLSGTVILGRLPDFTADGGFFGAAAFVPTSGFFSQLPKSDKYGLVQEYRKHTYKRRSGMEAVFQNVENSLEKQFGLCYNKVSGC